MQVFYDRINQGEFDSTANPPFRDTPITPETDSQYSRAIVNYESQLEVEQVRFKNRMIEAFVPDFEHRFQEEKDFLRDAADVAWSRGIQIAGTIDFSTGNRYPLRLKLRAIAEVFSDLHTLYERHVRVSHHD
jgi:hypothetical protein